MGSFSIFHWVIAAAMILGTIFAFLMLISSFRRSAVGPKRSTASNARLDELSDLRSRKLISEEEFARKRAEIIRDL